MIKINSDNTATETKVMPLMKSVDEVEYKGTKIKIIRSKIPFSDKSGWNKNNLTNVILDAYSDDIVNDKEVPEKGFILVTNSGIPIITYHKPDDFKMPKVSLFEAEPSFPDNDSLIEFIEHNKKGLNQIMIIDKYSTILPYGENKKLIKEMDNLKEFNNNKYSALEKYIGKIYDGKLNIPELDKYKGMQFGGAIHNAYNIDFKYCGRDVISTAYFHLPKIDSIEEIRYGLFKVKNIQHKGFISKKDHFLKGKPTFHQKLEVGLGFYKPFHLSSKKN